MLPGTSSRPASGQSITTATQGSSLVDVLERVLDKGIVIAGDISVSVGSTELLSIRIRLLISSVDKAREIGINWWESDPHLGSQSRQLIETNQQLQSRLESLESELKALRAAQSVPAVPPAHET
ncbi:MAG: gas vesicle protein [Leptolyngbyaceae cyanobacterium SM1_1_3]|nr:gas vesicle protein [Leptolyngbyaceae cyanobacterium SM1_1_3]NJN03370.1 gas vesicle protein [Leptolyngbyaceae cyanobacterium RM1_1_2]NJO11809.1 gas vesicle protein [Leptolyngbyaceae cyanobacterium SL_1_1]